MEIRFTFSLLVVCTLWSFTDCTTTAPSSTADVTPSVSTVTPSQSTVTTQPATTPPPPDNVENVDVTGQNETSITIQFQKVEGITEYKLYYGTDNNENVTAGGDTLITHTVNDLSPAQNYSMRLCSVSAAGKESPGFSFSASTAPENVDNFKAVHQNESSITLEWTENLNISEYSLKFEDEDRQDNFTTEEMRYVVLNLNSSTYYNFTLYTVFDDITSTGTKLTAHTAPSKAEGFEVVTQNETSITLQWKNDVQGISYTLWYDGTNVSFTAEELNNLATHTVTGLQNATVYTFSLVTVFAGKLGTEVNITTSTAPRNAERFRAVNQNETSITLQWDRVPGITEYNLQSVNGNFNITEERNEETITNLEHAILYNFTLFAVFKNVTSSGSHLRAATAPRRVSSVEVTERTLNTITLQWQSVRKDLHYSVQTDGRHPETVPPKEGLISYTVKSLDPGTVYSFNITTVFKPLPAISVNSTSFPIDTVTVIECGAVDWPVTENTIEGRVVGAFTNATASNDTHQHPNTGSGQDIKFTGLYPGATYNVILMYYELEQCDNPLTVTTVPPRLTAKCKNCNGGYSICVEWDSPDGIWNLVEITISDEVYKRENKGERNAVLSNFQPAKKYQASITSVSGSQKNKQDPFTCKTDDRGVIAGAFFGVVLFLILVCAVVFIMLRRPDLLRRKKSAMGGARTSVRKSKPVPLEKFPAHFNELSADENKGFSLEYEDLALVGTDQSQKAATVQENRPKNRFVNVLPYDRSRVKLTSSTPHNDYINASYMPGYNSDREFIAAQGPMPSTVNDFWRMIWEQKVKGIVMVTNCTEGGRTKCEQYWNDSGPRVCGDLAVFTTSEQKETDWTLREFKVKNRRTSEERTVKHFHFTAWPDHGVPQGTEVLIQFRALVRRHIQIEAAGAPTVVHCSAGVGRTGTIIALDMLLQQLEKEKAVNINGFVHKMRLNRPHMVQTESQYVFLHQCALDSLRLNDTREENIYENELIYANATALKEYQNNMNKA